MKNIWLLWLIVPAVLTGCLQLPGQDSHNQTVQHGPPTPIDPNLPPGQRPAAKAGGTVSSAQPKSGQVANQPGDLTDRLPPPANQIEAGNVEQALRIFQDQLDRDSGNSSAPAKTHPPSGWQK